MAANLLDSNTETVLNLLLESFLINFGCSIEALGAIFAETMGLSLNTIGVIGRGNPDASCILIELYENIFEAELYNSLNLKLSDPSATNLDLRIYRAMGKNLVCQCSKHISTTCANLIMQKISMSRVSCSDLGLEILHKGSSFISREVFISVHEGIESNRHGRSLQKIITYLQPSC